MTIIETCVRSNPYDPNIGRNYKSTCGNPGRVDLFKGPGRCVRGANAKRGNMRGSRQVELFGCDYGGSTLANASDLEICSSSSV